MKFIDLTGKKFGFLTAIERTQLEKSGTYWLCKCDCGKMVEARSHALRNGDRKHCGCSVGFKDLTGKRYGKLLVVKRADNLDNKVAWLCKCDCGGEKIIKGKNLIKGWVKSCGCLWKYDEGVASCRALYGNYKRNAKYRKRKFDIDFDDFKKITKQNCYYCNAEPSQIGRFKQCNGYYIYNGLDRINNDKGYTLENCVPCCKKCNYAKRDFSRADFYDLIYKIYKTAKNRGIYLDKK